MADLVTAPWTAEQVESLNGFQRSGVMHPFTCSGGGGPHSERIDGAVLVATESGWRCPVPDCTHQQDWAHPWMANGTWRQMPQIRFR